MPTIEAPREQAVIESGKESVSQDARSRLQDVAITDRQSAATTTDSQSTVNDKAAAANGNRVQFDNPYSHVAIAGAAIRELQLLAGHEDNEAIQIADSAGNVKDTTVKERRALLTTLIEREFATAIAGADSLDQRIVERSLLLLSSQQDKASSQAEKDARRQEEAALLSLKHAPSAIRFAFAMYLAGNSQLDKAHQLMVDAAALDPEAGKDPQFRQFELQLKDAITQNQRQLVNSEEYMLPLLTMNLADAQRKQANLRAAEIAYKKAIESADRLDQKVIAEQLLSIQRAKKEGADNPELIKNLEAQEKAWIAVSHSPALTRINHADLLLQQKRYKEAQVLLEEAQAKDPDLVKEQKQFQEMLEVAKTEGKSIVDNNPFAHFESFQKALEKGDVELARKKLQAAEKAADAIDRNLAQRNKQVIEEQLNKETDPKRIKELKQLHQIYDAFDHASAFARIVRGRFELAAKNYNLANSSLTDARNIDPDFVKRPEVEFDKLIGAAHEPSTWTKVLAFTKNLLKELIADAAAIGAGALAVGLTGWTGPGAILAGAAAGAAAYTGVKALMGEDIHWYTPLWGAVDGMSGALSMLARQVLVNAGGKIITKELAETAVLKTGGTAGALTGMQGLEMAGTARQLAAGGLKAMGKDLSMWTRLASTIPFFGAGNAEYRAALSAYRALNYSTIAVSAGVNFGTAATMSAVYRGAHEAVNYYNGAYPQFSEFAKAYGVGVFRDAVTGMVLGAFAQGYGEGLMVSGTVNGIKTAAGQAEDFADFLNTWTQSVSQDMAFASVSWLLGVGSRFGGRYIPSLPGAVNNFWLPSAPIWSNAYYTNQYIKQSVHPVIDNLSKPVPPEDILKRYHLAPGPLSYPAG